ncbi:MAG TPA: glycosyltransferase family 39 protein, partial [Phototrophicaceae bacterium]|nr:glycosyltransferase family 39 protein [Phototrophicaceae bacterium]
MADVVSTQFEVKTRGWGLTRSDVLVGVLLALVLLFGAYFRFVGQNWDDFVRFHPDERFLSSVVSSLNGPLIITADFPQEMQQRCLERYPATGGRGGFFDAECSALNPNNTGNGLYVYGTLPTFMVRWTADLLVNVTGNNVWGDYSAVHLVGRALSAIAEVGVILAVFFIGCQLHGRVVGLVAAALYAFAVFSIQQAHFWTTDPITNLFCVLAIWAAIRVQLHGGLGNYLGFGLWAGAAVASRINTVPLVGLLLVAWTVQLFPAFDRRLAWRERQRLFGRSFTGLILAGFMTFLVFRVGNPYAFNGPGFFGIINLESYQNSQKVGVQRLLDAVFNPRWLQDMGEAQHLVSGNAESPPNWQWVGRTRYVFPFTKMVLWGMGVALGLTGWACWVWSGWRLVRGKAGALANLLPVIWILVYFGWLGNQWVMSMRYYLPMYPILAILAAWGLVEIVRRADRSGVVWRKTAARVLLAGVVGFTALWALMFTNIYRHLFTPAAAGHWIIENIPSDFSMQVEGADAPLINIAVPNGFGGDDTPLEMIASRFETGQVFTTTFTVPADGTITQIHAPHLAQLDGSSTEPADIHFTIGSPEGEILMTEGRLQGDLPRDTHILGSAYDIPLQPALEVRKGETYGLRIEVITGGPVISGGTVFTWEGSWDEVVPPKVCQLLNGMTLADDPPAGLSNPDNCTTGVDLWYAYINGYKQEVYWDENEGKRERFELVLNNSDYLIIGTNRRYDSQSRIP